MARTCRKMVQSDLRRKIQRPFLILSRCILRFWDQILVCSLGNRPIRYRMLPQPLISAVSPSPLLPTGAKESISVSEVENITQMMHNTHDDKDSDVVPLKISLLGDCQIGKTSFLAKYVGNQKENESIRKRGLNLMDKTLMVEGARISYRLWEVNGKKLLSPSDSF
uniref:Sgp1 monomeric G-protein n=1 Tax=Rhizophora mucronata TaxID=61149 RepID=A0A2P2K074_RHIMU